MLLYMHIISWFKATLQEHQANDRKNASLKTLSSPVLWFKLHSQYIVVLVIHISAPMLDNMFSDKKNEQKNVKYSIQYSM